MVAGCCATALHRGSMFEIPDGLEARLQPNAGWEFVDRLAFDHPLPFSLAVTVIFLFLLVIAILIGTRFREDRGWNHFGEAVGRLLGALVLILALNRLDWLLPAGIRLPAGWRLWALAAAPTVYAAIAFPYALTGSWKLRASDPLQMGFLSMNAASAALIEEIAFRGLVLFALLRAWGGGEGGTFGSVLVSSLLFGSVHLLNLFAGEAARRVAAQALWSALGAVAFGALVIVGSSIWPAVLFHASANVAVRLARLAQPDQETTLSSLLKLNLLALPVAAYGLFLLIAHGLV